ncbi:hypothetical protein HYT26_02525 [Candidatus Pacearchaeota archaeon]|nr:hypothetical protein [Candidatus Pacearchaeota archaeon]
MEEQQVRFNAGLDISLTISTILKRCEYFAREQDFASWFNELRILERRLYSKIIRSKKSKELLEEIKKASEDRNNILGLYQKKVNRGRNIPLAIVHQLYSYLAGYEIVLRKYVDVFGYGAPDIESQEKAILQK